MNSLMLGIAILVGEPGLKDPPEKDPAIVGEWTQVSMTTAGRAGPKAQEGTVFVFTKDGKFKILVNGKEATDSTRDYRVNVKEKPMQIDLATDSTGLEGRPFVAGIFKIEGDTLTLSHIAGGQTRPKDFETGKASRSTVVVYKRVTKKK